VTFTNLSSGPLVSCNWEFGDGGSSDLCANPTYTYNQEGIYTVTLTVQGAEQTDVRVKRDYIRLRNERRLYLPLLQASPAAR
jgi:PKD repeat protein